FLRPHEKHNEVSGFPRLSHGRQILIGEIDRLADALLGQAHTPGGPLGLSQSLRHIRRYVVLSAKKLQDRQSMFAAALLGDRPVAETEILEFPDELQVEVAARAEIRQIAVDAAAEIAARQQVGRAGRGWAEDNAGHERPDAFLLEPR